MVDESTGKNKNDETIKDKRRKLQDLHLELMVFRADLHDLEKTASRMNNESMKLYEELEDMLDG